MYITFITGNKGKYEEAREIIPDLKQADIDLPEIQNTDINQIIKAKLYVAREQIEGNIVVEDGSLIFECLNGLPGPLIKWFLKTIGNEGLAKIVKAYGNNRAEAKVVVGFLSESGKEEYFEGAIKGSIVEPRGENGFGWDPIFLPEGFDKTFGEMTIEEKGKISMREIAFEKLKSYLETN